MTHYDVDLQPGHGRVAQVRLHIDAASPSEAVMIARRSGLVAVDVESYTVFRRRRLGRSRRVGTFPAGGDDGSAGVREPRRPHPSPSGTTATLHVPLHPDS